MVCDSNSPGFCDNATFVCLERMLVASHRSSVHKQIPLKNNDTTFACLERMLVELIVYIASIQCARGDSAKRTDLERVLQLIVYIALMYVWSRCLWNRTSTWENGWFYVHRVKSPLHDDVMKRGDVSATWARMRRAAFLLISLRALKTTSGPCVHGVSLSLM